jgi:hypothetical protein
MVRTSVKARRPEAAAAKRQEVTSTDRAFADCWGVPVQATSGDAVAQLGGAVEMLAALGGDPVAARQLLIANPVTADSP